MFAILFSCVSLSYAQNRFIKPIQIQMNNSGLIHVSLGNLFNDKTQKRVQVQDWVTPGLEVGFHISPRFYIGYGMDPARHITTREFMSLSNSAPEGTAHMDLYPLQSHRINLRYFPSKIDAYAEFGAVLKGSQFNEMKFERYGETAKYGDTHYATDLAITWRSPAHWMPTVGMGYNWVYRSGFSFDIGFTVPLDVLNKTDVTVDIVTRDEEISLSDDDKELLRKKISEYSFYSPVSFRLNVGYNFPFGNRESKPFNRDTKEKKQKKSKEGDA